MKDYIGNPLQIRGAEKYVLQGAKGEGMHFLYIRNGKGLELWLSLDRAGDVSRLNFKGDNMGFFAPCGYVAPQYYDEKGAGFLKSFTAGFFTTCGLTAVGSPCIDEGEELGLHGTISNIPAELLMVGETDEALSVKLRIRDTAVFGRKLVLNRKYTFSYTQNEFEVEDTVTNEGDATSPYMILYHCNMGYPLVCESSVVKIPHSNVVGRNEYAQSEIEKALLVEAPQSNFEEKCYYFDVKEKGGKARAGIYSPLVNKGMVMSYDKSELPKFTEWQMFGKTDYVLGLEPGNCTPDGRDVLRKNGTLKFIEAGESKRTAVKFAFADDMADFDSKL